MNTHWGYTVHIGVKQNTLRLNRTIHIGIIQYTIHIGVIQYTIHIGVIHYTIHIVVIQYTLGSYRTHWGYTEHIGVDAVHMGYLNWGC